jgi:hypothetical protein
MNQEHKQLIPSHYFKKKTNCAPTKYIPIEDGFITSAGNPTLAAKYGNNLVTNIIKNQDIEADKNIDLKG